MAIIANIAIASQTVRITSPRMNRYSSARPSPAVAGAVRVDLTGFVGHLKGWEAEAAAAVVGGGVAGTELSS
jgi:hypothetical protein